MWRTWRLLRSAGVEKPLARTVGMLLRGSIDEELLTAIDHARKADLPITPLQLEAQYVAGGRPSDLVAEMVRLEEHGKRVDHQVLARIDLLQGDLTKTVQDSLHADDGTVEDNLKALADQLTAERQHLLAQRPADRSPDRTSGESRRWEGWRGSLLVGLVFLLWYVTSEAVIENPPPWIDAVSSTALVALGVLVAVEALREIVDLGRWRQVLILTLVLMATVAWLWIDLLGRNAR